MPGAAVAVLKDGEIIDAAARRAQHRRPKVEATPDSVFQIGSITKVWTATLVMQLVDDGLLDLDAPIRRYLPEFRLADESAAASDHHPSAAQPPGRLRGRRLHRHRSRRRRDREVRRRRSRTCRSSSRPASSSRTTTSASACSAASSRCCAARPGSRRSSTTSSRRSGSPTSRRAPTRRSSSAPPSATSDPARTASRSPAPIWALARSNEPAGSMLAMRPRDLARLRRDAPRRAAPAADGTRVLSEASAARHAHRAGARCPRLTGMGEAWGLGWEIITDGRAHRHRPRRRHDRPGRVPARRPRGRPRRRAAHQRRRRVRPLRGRRRARS